MALVEVDLIPAQVDQLTDPQAVPIGDEDHGGVAVTPAVLAGRLDQLLDLGLGQVLAGPQFGVGTRCRHGLAANCSFFDGWSHELEVLFRHGFLSLFMVNC